MIPDWTPYVAAQSLLELFPGLGRLMTVRLREAGEEEATMMQIGVLMHLHEHSITTSELARRRKVSLQSASVLAQGLVDRGWLVRVADPQDRRQSLLQVTPEGAARAKELQSHVTNTLAELLGKLTAEELNAAGVFLPALRRIIAEQMQSDNLSEPRL